MLDWNEQECRKLVEDYQKARIVERHEVVNRNIPDWESDRQRANIRGLAGAYKFIEGSS